MASSKSNVQPASFTPDDRQREAIEHVHGPMLVVAGAGTGKTSVLIRRIERLVREGHARADEILALTYTVNAADEMQERLGKLLGGQKVYAATFHDYCLNFCSGYTKISAYSTKKIFGFICGGACASFILNTTCELPARLNS
jgi:superfamily I DNA/RNA helicase